MFKKRAVVVSTAAGLGSGSAIKDISTALGYWGVSDIIKYGISVHAMNWDMVSEKNKSKIEKTTDKIAKELSRTPKPKVSIKTKALFGIMRMIQVKGMGSSEVEKNYWEKNGWLSKERPWK